MVPAGIPVSAAVVSCRGRDRDNPVCRCRRRSRARRLSNGLGLALLAAGALTAASWSTGAPSIDAAGSGPGVAHPAAATSVTRSAGSRSVGPLAVALDHTSRTARSR